MDYLLLLKDEGNKPMKILLPFDFRLLLTQGSIHPSIRVNDGVYNAPYYSAFFL